MAKKQSKKPRVLVAMSGGVDSSVAALLMKQKGYEVVGAFMKNWSDTKDDLGQCTWRGERKMALKVAAMLDIPLKTLDFEKQYRNQVVEKMYEDYAKGLIPNPDVDCNQKIKFPYLIQAAKKAKADYLVTGHFARKRQTKSGDYELLRAKDENKDQSYFIYRIKQKELEKTIFPIGDYTKEEVRKIAEKHGFPNSDKKSTVGICFIGKVGMKDFLKKKIKPKKGKILDPEGNKIGEHDGIYYYAIGQRIGPRYGIEIDKNATKTEGSRWYVAKKNKRKNEIIAAPQGHEILYRKEITITKPHWITETPNKNQKNNVKARIRQVGELIPSKLTYDKNKKQFKLTFKHKISNISSGQAAVLYQNKKCLGGGEIRIEK